MSITQKSTTLNRPDLKTRMANRRRLPHPTRNSTSTTTAAHNTLGQGPQLIVTYSEFLGRFDDDPPSLHTPYRPSGLSFATAPFDAYEPLEPGPSRAQYSGAYLDPRSPDYIVESGWTTDVFGRQQWVGHGRIEEVDDDADKGEDNFATPRAKSTARASLSAGGDYDSNGFREEDIPLNSTPPPCPRPKKLPSLRATPTGSDYQSFKATSTVPPAMAALGAASASGLGLDDTTEVALVKENLDLLESSQEDVKFMNTFFLAKSAEHELSQQIDLCSHMEESLASLRLTLTLRTQIGAEEWNVRSPSWHQKYSKRLLSLRTTLQRLARMRQLVEIHSLRPRQRSAILAKLEQHEAKLADLASKYSTAFDRLRLRHLHFLLTQSHNEAKRQKAQKPRLMSRASFERRWKEGKTLRETLRVNFQDLRQEFYNNSQRSARHPSAP